MILPDCPQCAELLAPLRADTGGFWWVTCLPCEQQYLLSPEGRIITRQDPVKAAEELRRIREEQDY